MTSITIFGGAGMIGQRVLAEALNRGHRVTAVVRSPSAITIESENLTIVEGDVNDSASVAEHAAGADAVIGSVPPPRVEGSSREIKSAALVDIARALVEGVRATRGRAPYLAVVGGAGTLDVAPGVRLVDSPAFPAVAMWEALAHADMLDYLRTVTDIDWTSFAPAAKIFPGERTGEFRLGVGSLVRDAEGESRISAEDYAIALVNEVERRENVGRQFTVGY